MTSGVLARRRRGGRALGLLRDAVRGRSIDAAEGPVRRAVILLAVPMVLEMAMESVFAVVDIFFVSRLGAEAVAAVGFTESLLAIIYTVAVGLSIGVTAMVARRIGEGDREAAAHTAFQALALGFAISLVLAFVGVLYAERLLGLMGAGDDVIAIGAGYTRVTLGANVVVLLLFLMNAAFRGAGDAGIAMRVLWLANGLNIVLNPLLIFGIGPFPELGVTGAAVGTVIGRGTGVIAQLLILAGGAGVLRLAARHARLAPALMLRLLRLSGSGMLQVFISTASWIGMIRIVAMFGSDAIAGYTIAIRVVLFALLPAWGLANAAATMVGQGLGAGRADRAEEAVWIAARLNLAFLGSVGVVFMVAAPWIVGIFAADGAAAGYAVHGLRILSAGFFFYAFGMVLTQSFNGAGDTRTPMLLNLLCFWCWEIPLAWFLAHRVGMGPDGAFLAVTIAFSTLAVVSAALFRRGKWKLQMV
ncbi:MAG TPA: MATE family efflux transporter [Longimicrobiales bacterium]|nr:MATE family efflux transporter [Longimicrobiales bacterium]